MNERDVRHVLSRCGTPGRAYSLVGDGGFAKIVVASADPTRGLRLNDLAAEAELLDRARGVRGVPAVRSFEDHGEYQVLTLDNIEPRPGAGAARLSVAAEFALALQLFRTVWALSMQRISHNDIKFDNLIVDREGRLWLVDFDQASVTHSRWVALLRNTLGSRYWRSTPKVHGSIATLFKSALKRRKLRAMQKLPDRRTVTTQLQRQLYDAWELAQVSDANAPGHRIAYYALTVDGLHLPGERSWEDRWQVLRGICDYSGKRVLELGCNMGLLSVHLKMQAGAAAVLGVDHDERIIEAARSVAKSFDVDAQFEVVDLNVDREAVERLHEYAADIVTCLNVWNWVPDRRLLVDLLSAAPEVVYEGHDSAEVETSRLESLGFSRVRLVSLTERGRPLLHGSRK